MIRHLLCLVLVLVSCRAHSAGVDLSFYTQPFDYTSVTNGTAVFRCVPNFSVNQRFSWLENGVALSNGGGVSGATTDTLTITATAARNGKRYSCLVNADMGKGGASYNPTTTREGTLTVVATAPALAITPSSGSALTGGSLVTIRTTGQGAVWTYAFSSPPASVEIFPDRYASLQTFEINLPSIVSGTLSVTCTAGAASVTNTYPLQSENLAPIATGDDYRVPKALIFKGYTLTVPAARGVLANDSDPNGTALTAILVTPPGVGTLTLNPDGGFTWAVPATNPTVGILDSFVYKASDGTLNSGDTTVFLQALPSPGDLNLDGVVDAQDLEIVTSRMGVHYP